MNSNWFKFFVASQINCQLQSLRCYYAKELKKTKSSKKKSGSDTNEIYSSKWPYFTILDSFLREQITPRQSISTLVTFTWLCYLIV